jgi:hypothetical protein
VSSAKRWTNGERRVQSHVRGKPSQLHSSAGCVIL